MEPPNNSLMVRVTLSVALYVSFAVGAWAQVPYVPLAPRSLHSNDVITASVVHVVDGDTIDVEMAPGIMTRVRVVGVDAPEKGEPYARQATILARVTLLGQKVTIRPHQIDGRGRLVGHVDVEGRDYGTLLIRKGLACTYRIYLSESALENALREAISSEVGFWAADNGQPSCVAREYGTVHQALNSVPQIPIDSFIGNIRRRIYHAATCRNAGCKNCTARFASEDDARNAGYRPAGDCLRNR